MSVRLDLYGALADAGKEILSAALKKTGGNISRAAGMLGIPRQILYYKLKKHPD